MNYVIIKRLFSAFLALYLVIFLCVSVKAEENYQMVYRCNENCKNKIALTFDDGPHPKQTERILKVLEKYDIKATFFVIGVNVDNYQDTLLKVLQAGHEIGNHTNSHSQLKSMPKQKIEFEICECARKVEKVTNQKTVLIRPPCGIYDNNLVEIAEKNNYKIILWNIDTHDWAHCGADEMSKNIKNNVKGGDIVLFHDYISGKNDTIKTLENIIPALKAKGYEFVTVSELIEK